MNSVLRELFNGPKRKLAVCMVLALGTILAFLRVGGCGFVNFDDFYLIVSNPMVHGGLTLTGLSWGLTTTFYEYWHPVTWWSHMFDWQVFGANPAGHHWMSLAWHTANTLLLFAVWERMTGKMWASAVVAALFGFHPLHVESVAWIAERKDLVSAFFMLCSIWYYVRYVEESKKPGQEQEGRRTGLRKFYALALVSFALGLMSKPMVVTLPCVLILLDFWPLRRNAEWTTASAHWRGLVMEKIPFFLLSLGSCAVTFLGVKSGDNIVSEDTLPRALRWANIPISYVRYLWKTIFPADLAVFYPMPAHWPAWQVAAAVLLLLGITLAVLILWRRAPYLAIGWFVFLGVMFPTTGVVPVGFQAIADRYMYLPSIGLFVAVVWGVADLAARWKIPGRTVIVLAVAVLLACGILTCVQTGHWRDSYSLWTQCLRAAPESATAHFNLAAAYAELGKTDPALEELRTALRLKPEDVAANYYMGVVLLSTGRANEATNSFQTVLQLQPAHKKARVSLALALLQLGDARGALAECDRAIQADPASAAGHVARGRILSAQGKSEEAMASYAAALKCNANDYDAQYYLGFEWMNRGNAQEAIPAFRKATELDATNPMAHFELALALAINRQTGEAATEYRKALGLRPDWPEALNNLAWILATSPDGSLRNGDEAVRLATRACELTEGKQTQFWGTLSVAYAEAGQFDKAVETAQKTGDLAASRGETALANNTRALLDLFRNHKPYHEGK